MTEDYIFDHHLKPLEAFGMHFESIECRAYNPAFPDVIYGNVRTGLGTIELKVLTKLRDVNAPDWQQGQIAKNKTLQRYSNFVWLLIWIEGVFYLLHDFQHSYTRQELKELSWYQAKVLDKSFTKLL